MQTMDGIFTNLKRTFQSGNILSKLIYINVGLFILIRLASVLFMLFNVQGVPFLQYLQLPASPELLLFGIPFPDSAVELVYLYVYACELYAYPV